MPFAIKITKLDGSVNIASMAAEYADDQAFMEKHAQKLLQIIPDADTAELVDVADLPDHMQEPAEETVHVVRSAEELRQEAITFAKTELADINSKKIDALTVAVLTGDTSRLQALEAHAVLVRAQLDKQLTLEAADENIKQA